MSGRSKVYVWTFAGFVIGLATGVVAHALWTKNSGKKRVRFSLPLTTASSDSNLVCTCSENDNGGGTMTMTGGTSCKLHPRSIVQTGKLKVEGASSANIHGFRFGQS